MDDNPDVCRTGDNRHIPRVSPGQVAYEQDVAAHPRYHANGAVRPTWAQLSEIARWSWERNPTPRGGLVV